MYSSYTYTASSTLFSSGASEFIFGNFNNAFTGETGSTPRIVFVDTGGTLSINDSTINRPRYINSFGIFNTLSSITISNTAAETSIISPILTGTTTLFSATKSYNPELIPGRKYRFNAKGTINTPDNVNLTIRIKLSSTTISSSSTISVGDGIDAYSSEIEIDTTFTVRNSGLIVGSGKIMFLTFPPSNLGGDPIIFGIYSQNATVATTLDHIFDCTAQFSTADPSNNITITESTLEILN
jgi:hypothetical protein